MPKIEPPHEPKFFEGICGSVENAMFAQTRIRELFEHIEGVTSYGFKRTGTSIIFRFDDGPHIQEELLEALSISRLFASIGPASEDRFWRTRNE